MKTPYMERFPDVPIALGEQLKRCSDMFGERPAIFDGRLRLTWSQVYAATEHLSIILLEQGVRRGDRILIGMERRYEIVLAYLSVARIGAIAVPFNFKATQEEQRQALELIRPSGGLFHRQVLEQVVLPGCPFWALCLDDADYHPILRRPSGQSLDTPRESALPEIDPDSPVYLNMTSGSMGVPKAALASHRTLYGNTRACVEALALDEHDVHLPLFAVMAHPHEIFCRALFTGAAIAMLDNLYPRTIAETIQTCRVTCIMAVAPVYKLLLPFLSPQKYNIAALRLVESGGMSTPVALSSKFLETTGVPIIPVWGSTESMGIAFSSALDGSTPPNSVGRSLPGYSVKIIDRNGDQLAAGEVGEMCLRGTGVMLGYWSSSGPDTTALKDGWYHTGDLFEQDRKGNYFFHGRLDAMMKVGGLKIYPAEIEAALFSHPLVREAVIIPFEDADRGLLPMAVIVTEPGETLNEKQLRQFLKHRLARNKMPKIFRFLPELPRTSSGKIDRKALSAYGDPELGPSEESLKKRLEAIDLKILHLLNERLRIENAIGPETRVSGFKPELIQETIQKLLKFNPGPLHDSLVEELFNKILSLRTLY